MNAQPFKANIPQEILDDLQLRLKNTRWLNGVGVSNDGVANDGDANDAAGWDHGTSLDYLKELVTYWQTKFDWRRQEATINLFSQFRAEIDGVGIHFVHERGKGPDPFPIILTHATLIHFCVSQNSFPCWPIPQSMAQIPPTLFMLSLPACPVTDFPISRQNQE